MPSILDKIDAKRSYDESQGLQRASGDATWANTFNSVPSDEKLRANLNLDEMIATATANKIRRIQETDPKLGLDYARQQEVLARTQHSNDMAPLNVQRRQAQIESEITRDKAMARTDAFKARAAEQEAQDMEIFHAGMEDGLRSGIRIGTPEYADLAARMRLKAPAMKSEYFDDLWKATTRSPLSSEEAVKLEGMKAEERARGKARGTPPKVETTSVTDTTTSVNTPSDINLPVTTTHRSVTTKQPVSEIKKNAPMTGREFLDSLKR